MGGRKGAARRDARDARTVSASRHSLPYSLSDRLHRQCTHRLLCALCTMPARKSKAQAAATAPTATQPETPPAAVPFFPFARYTSIVGVHTSLLAFSTLLLPTTPTALLSKGLAGLQTGDRPRRAVVQVLTENPVRTVAWICAGTLLLQGWWAGWVRKWLYEQRSQTDGTDVIKQKLERQESGNQRNVVCPVVMYPIPSFTSSPDYLGSGEIRRSYSRRLRGSPCSGRALRGTAHEVWVPGRL